MIVRPLSLRDHLFTPNAPILMNVPENKTNALSHSKFFRLKEEVSCVIAQPKSLRDYLLTPFAPVLMNVPKNKTHALTHSNYVRMK